MKCYWSNTLNMDYEGPYLPNIDTKKIYFYNKLNFVEMNILHIYFKNMIKKVQ